MLEYKGLCKIVVASAKWCYCLIGVPGCQPTKRYLKARCEYCNYKKNWCLRVLCKRAGKVPSVHFSHRKRHQLSSSAAHHACPVTSRAMGLLHNRLLCVYAQCFQTLLNCQASILQQSWVWFVNYATEVLKGFLLEDYLPALLTRFCATLTSTIVQLTACLLTKHNIAITCHVCCIIKFNSAHRTAPPHLKTGMAENFPARFACNCISCLSYNKILAMPLCTSGIWSITGGILWASLCYNMPNILTYICIRPYVTTIQYTWL